MSNITVDQEAWFLLSMPPTFNRKFVMGILGRQVHIRLTAELTVKLEELQRQFGGIPNGILLKMVMASLLERPLDEQIEVITGQIRKTPRKTARVTVGGNTRRPM